jgi:hypothetical protein
VLTLNNKVQALTVRLAILTEEHQQLLQEFHYEKQKVTTVSDQDEKYAKWLKAVREQDAPLSGSLAGSIQESLPSTSSPTYPSKIEVKKSVETQSVRNNQVITETVQSCTTIKNLESESHDQSRAPHRIEQPGFISSVTRAVVPAQIYNAVATAQNMLKSPLGTVQAIINSSTPDFVKLSSVTKLDDTEIAAAQTIAPPATTPTTTSKLNNYNINDVSSAAPLASSHSATQVQQTPPFQKFDQSLLVQIMKMFLSGNQVNSRKQLYILRSVSRSFQQAIATALSHTEKRRPLTLHMSTRTTHFNKATFRIRGSPLHFELAPSEMDFNSTYQVIQPTQMPSGARTCASFIVEWIGDPNQWLCNNTRGHFEVDVEFGGAMRRGTMEIVLKETQERVVEVDLSPNGDRSTMIFMKYSVKGNLEDQMILNAGWEKPKGFGLSSLVSGTVQTGLKMAGLSWRNDSPKEKLLRFTNWLMARQRAALRMVVVVTEVSIPTRALFHGLQTTKPVFRPRKNTMV